MKIAIIHDYLNQFGGAEKVIEVMHEIFPEAPIYTSIFKPECMPSSFDSMKINVSFMQRLPLIDKHFKKYLLLYPKAMSSFNLNEYDLVISSSSAFAKGIKKSKNFCHICYCYSPMRFVWDYDNYIQKENIGLYYKKILPFFMSNLKKWDLRTNNGVDHFIAISNNIRKRIKDCYNRESTCIYPPVDVKNFYISKEIEDYFLIVSRLNAYKNIDLVIKVFNDSNLKLKIVGDGPFKESLIKIAKSKNIEFLGRVSFKELSEIYSRCRAFIFPGKEDFGIAPLEAQASGRPVIAFGHGGALETIVENETGIFFRHNTEASLKDAIERFLGIEKYIVPLNNRKNALRFDREIFKDKFKDFVLEKYKDFKKI